MAVIFLGKKSILGKKMVFVILEFIMLLESTGHESALRQGDGQDEFMKYLSRPISTSL